MRRGRVCQALPTRQLYLNEITIEEAAPLLPTRLPIIAARFSTT
jgi:hypothetical protein